MSLALEGDAPIVKAALNRARDNGIPTVVAAGNDGKPISNDKESMRVCKGKGSAMCVGACNKFYSFASFSSYGKDVDIIMPGREVIVGTIGDRSYDIKSGTSYAAPAMAGILAIFISEDELNRNKSTWSRLVSIAFANALKGELSDVPSSQKNILGQSGIGHPKRGDAPFFRPPVRNSPKEKGGDKKNGKGDDNKTGKSDDKKKGKDNDNKKSKDNDKNKSKDNDKESRNSDKKSKDSDKKSKDNDKKKANGDDKKGKEDDKNNGNGNK